MTKHSSSSPFRTSPAADQPAKLGIDQPVDHRRIERAVREILLAVGEDPDREGLLRTPRRVADALTFIGPDDAEWADRIRYTGYDRSESCCWAAMIARTRFASGSRG